MARQEPVKGRGLNDMRRPQYEKHDAEIEGKITCGRAYRLRCDTVGHVEEDSDRQRARLVLNSPCRRD